MKKLLTFLISMAILAGLSYGFVFSDNPGNNNSVLFSNQNYIPAVLNSQSPMAPVLTEGFEGGVVPPAGWVNLQGGAGNLWSIATYGTPAHTGTYAAEVKYNSANAANAWLISPGVSLTINTIYTITYWEKTSSSYPEQLKVTVGLTQDIAGQTTTIQDLGSHIQATYILRTATFTAPETNTFYFGWNCYSLADEYYEVIDDISIDPPPEDPTLYVDPISLAFGYVPYPGTSATQTYSLSGINLTAGPIVVTAPTGFEVSLDGTNWFSTVNVTYTPPTLAATTISVHFVPLAAGTPYSGIITNVGGGVTLKAPLGMADVAVTGSSALIYCASGATSTVDDDIGNVTFGTINNGIATPELSNPTSVNTYTDFTGSVAPTNINQGGSYPISVSGIWSDVTGYTCGISVYIDFNLNGTFETVEGKYLGTLAPGAPCIGTVDVPPTATLNSNVRMRVIEVESGTTLAPACGTYTWGETEDYFVNITPGMANDVGAYSIDFGPVLVTGAQIPKATIKNYGVATQAGSFNTNMTINPGGYSFTAPSTPGLIPGGTEQLSFPSWTPTPSVLYTVTVTTQLAGDGNPSNDAMTITATNPPGVWSTGTVYPTTTYMGTGCSYVSTTKATTAYVFSLGGNTTSGLGTECYQYDVIANTWTAITSLPAKRVVLASAVVADQLYAIGGSDGAVYVNTVFKYDILAGGAWTPVATLPKTIAWGKATTYNGKIYLAGGVDAFTGGVVIPDVYVYDPGANTWTAATFMPGPKFGGAFSNVGNKLVYAAGADLAVISNTVYVGTIDPLDPTGLTINWAVKANKFPGIKEEIKITKEGNLTDVVKPVGNDRKEKSNKEKALGTYPAGAMYRFDGANWGATEMIVAGGSPSASWVPANPNPCYTYDPATDIWAQQFNLTTPVLGSSLGSAEIPGFRKLVVASGYTGSIVTNATQIYSVAVSAPLNLGLTAMLSGHCDGTNMLYTKNIVVELRQAGTPYTLVESQPATLSLTGTCNPLFTVATNGTPYWIVITSNNGLETWSASTQTFTGSTLNYDFTSAATQAFGSNMLLVGTRWCIFSGDVDQDDAVGALDRGACWNERNLVGVYATDLDGDGSVGASDRAICWNNRNKALIKPTPGPTNVIKQENKGDKNNSKGTYDLRLDGSNSKKVTKTK